MKISEYISNDIAALKETQSIAEVGQLFNELAYSHLPVVKNNILLGSINADDIRTIDNVAASLKDYQYLYQEFHIAATNNWIEILKIFAASESNILPVLSENNEYIGYYELTDVLHFFNDTPLLRNDGFFLVIEKEEKNYSFSEIVQIVESSQAKLIGVFVSGERDNFIRITLKIASNDINEVIQSFRRFSYNVLTKHKEDIFLEQLKDRSNYLQKYLNI